MGGRKSAPTPPRQPKVDPMVAFTAMQQQQQAANSARMAEEENKRKIQEKTQAEQQAGIQAMQQSSESARQQVSEAGQSPEQQKADVGSVAGVPAPADTSSAKPYSAQQMATGSPIRPSMVPAVMAANQGVGGTFQRVNQFNVPQASGLTFGGA